jgi:hypothetical protein
MFFSVKNTIRMGGKVYIPCVCYEADKSLEPTLSKLSAEGKAVLYNERVFFQNGKVIDKTKDKARKAQPKARKVKKEVVPQDTEESEIEGF